MGKLRLHVLMRCAHVKRWQIVRVGREQNIAEHSFRVYLIATHISEILKSPLYLGTIQRWALWHDLPEIVTGDLSTTTKEKMGCDCIKNIEEGIDNEYDELKKAVDEKLPLEKSIVKMADYLEAIYFLNEEAIGVHAHEVLEKIILRFYSIVVECEEKYPTLPWDDVRHLI